MIEPSRDRTFLPSTVLACGLLALGIASAGAGEPKSKERPWPAEDAPARTATGCEYMGKGYIKAPGTDTCIRVSGYVRTDAAIIGR